ncbi:baculoviral IAP repeat-containing protein 3-like [Mercenaria mercenaria]|uniref:baculoviral IAP repeat-containing protein 3-like n=1 Tax=Mercenaria mercenaria TaxID=6596 RepID=UPI00234FB299|nr:baculoviral IAP repeat-containing protein 3-like [Mercenaria mercenaria]
MQDNGRHRNVILESDFNDYTAFESALQFCSTPTDFKVQTFCLVKHGKIIWGPLPTLAHGMVKKVKDEGLNHGNTGMDVALEIFRKSRSLVFIQLCLDIFIINNSDLLSLLKSKVTRQISNGALSVRRVDIDIFISLLHFIERHDADGCQNNSGERSYSSSKTRNKNKPEAVWDRMNDAKSVMPRPEHHTTAVKDFENSTTKIENEQTNFAYPLHSQEHNKPEISPSQDRTQRNEQEKHPIQATEIDAGQLSIGAYSFPDRHNALSQQTYEPENHTGNERNFIVSGTGLQRPPRYQEYDTKDKRLATFTTPLWVTHNKPQPDTLAEWGFFFVNKQDLVRCYQCGIGLKDWTEEDDVMTEHVKHSSSCLYLLDKLGQETVDQIKTALDNPSASNAVPLPYKIRSPRYQNMAARISSFGNFPGHIQVSHHQFAVAGLFYTGKGDLCRCFTCDGGLKDWSSGDDPVKEHATYFPNCPYINQLKGSQYVTSMQRCLHNQHEMTGASSSMAQERQADHELQIQNLTIQDSSFTVMQVIQKLGYAEADVFTAKTELERRGKLNPTAEEIMNTILDMQEKSTNAETTVSRQNSKEDLKAIAEENNKLSQMVFCMLCVTGEADILFLPCSHHRICHKCSVGITDCPVCGKFIQEKVKTFRS